MLDVYPVTIVADRYSGTYSGAAWLAFNLYDTQLPDGWDSDDVTTAEFWVSNKEVVGKGNSPQEAYEDLLRLLKSRGRSHA